MLDSVNNILNDIGITTQDGAYGSLLESTMTNKISKTSEDSRMVPPDTTYIKDGTSCSKSTCTLQLNTTLIMMLLAKG